MATSLRSMTEFKKIEKAWEIIPSIHGNSEIIKKKSWRVMTAYILRINSIKKKII